MVAGCCLCGGMLLFSVVCRVTVRVCVVVCASVPLCVHVVVCVGLQFLACVCVC